MSGINGDTVITMTMKQALAAVGALGVVLWGVASFTFGSLRHDVADIRAAVTETQSRNSDTLQTATKADSDLRAQLAELTAELKITNAGLAGLRTSVDGLDESLRKVDERLAASVSRQENFERWVVARLGHLDKIPTTVPTEWQKSEGAIVKTIISGDDPLSAWDQMISDR